jgi:hypothetical protein
MLSDLRHPPKATSAELTRIAAHGERLGADSRKDGARQSRS